MIYKGILWSFAALLLAVLFFMLESMPPFSSKIEPLVQANMAMSGVDHEVTAVLLNFRSLDTLLEIGVVLLAFIAIGVLAPQFRYQPYTHASTVTDVYITLLFPLIVLSAFYILLAGSYKSGGAFVAAALLAGGIIIVKLTKPDLFLQAQRIHLRFLAALGLLFFTAVALMSLLEGAFLQYPLEYASLLIVLIETLLMFSLAIILASFFINGVQRLQK
jgi:multisubunit Na+/H+ antiporter MnhB subunit